MVLYLLFLLFIQHLLLVLSIMVHFVKYSVYGAAKSPKKSRAYTNFCMMLSVIYSALFKK